MEGCLSPYDTSTFNSSSQNLRIKDAIEDNLWDMSPLQSIASIFYIHQPQHVSSLLVEGSNQHI